jgi:hypothetical protein
MTKKKIALLFIALFTFIGGIFAAANYVNINTLYQYSPSTGTYTIIPIYSVSVTVFIATTTLSSTYYRWNGSTWIVIPPGTRIYIVVAQ